MDGNVDTGFKRRSTETKTYETRKRQKIQRTSQILLLPIPSNLKKTIVTKGRTNETLAGKNAALKKSDADWCAKFGEMESSFARLKGENEAIILENEALKKSDAAWNAKFDEMESAFVRSDGERKAICIENEALKESEVAWKAKFFEMESAFARVKGEKEAVVIENDALKTSDAAWNAKFADVSVAFVRLKDENEAISMEYEELKKADIVNRAKIEELNAAIIVLKEDNVASSSKDEMPNEVSSEDDSSFKWINVVEEKDFKENNLKLKKSDEMAAQFVNYIRQNVFEKKMANFIKAAAKLTFTKRFFIDKLSYKHERGRVCVRDTQILNCLEVSVKENFKDVQDVAIDTFVQKTIKDFKGQLRRNEDLWDEI